MVLANHQKIRRLSSFVLSLLPQKWLFNKLMLSLNYELTNHWHFDGSVSDKVQKLECYLPFPLMLFICHPSLILVFIWIFLFWFSLSITLWFCYPTLSLGTRGQIGEIIEIHPLQIFTCWEDFRKQKVLGGAYIATILLALWWPRTWLEKVKESN